MVSSDFLHVGFGSFVKRSCIVEVRPNIVNQTELGKREALYVDGLVLDFTHGRLTRTVITMDSGHRVLVAVPLEEVKWRVQ